jgi:protein-S-isoprenylcysteine O-methyltransferase Ste14
MSTATTHTRNAEPAAAAARVLTLTLGLGVYVVFLATFLYLIGFVGSAFVPKTLDDGLVGDPATALAVNLGCLALFAVQHTVMARPAFKRWWTRIVPEPLERTTFVGVTCAILIGMVVLWRPLPETVWHVEGAAALLFHTVFWLGWGIVLLSTFLIDHFELFGVKQVLMHALGRERRTPHFQERFLYRYTRHPLMLGFLLAFWATPHMTQGHLFFASVTTAYILLALLIEERTLVALHGAAYQDYQRRVPKLIPRLRVTR